MTLTFTPIVPGVRRAAATHWAYWSILKAGRYHAFGQILPNGDMRPIGWAHHTLAAAESACQRHHEAGHPGVGAGKTRAVG